MAPGPFRNAQNLEPLPRAKVYFTATTTDASSFGLATQRHQAGCVLRRAQLISRWASPKLMARRTNSRRSSISPLASVRNSWTICERGVSLVSRTGREVSRLRRPSRDPPLTRFRAVENPSILGPAAHPLKAALPPQRSPQRPSGRSPRAKSTRAAR